MLILLQVLLAVGALAGGGAFILAPDGHLIQMPIGHLKNTPFPDFLAREQRFADLRAGSRMCGSLVTNLLQDG